MMKHTDKKMTTMIGKNSVVGGNLTVEGAARVDGIVEGSAKVTGILIIGSCGKIQGDVEAHSVVIGGEVNGDVTVQEKTELTSTARVIGDIHTSVIVIDEKATFQGKCDMNIATGKSKKRTVKERKVKKSAKDALKEALKEVSEENETEVNTDTDMESHAEKENAREDTHQA